MTNKFSTRIIVKPTTMDLCAIVELEKRCFPDEWIYKDAHDYYEETINRKETVAIFLQYNSEEVGFLIGQPLACLFDELSFHDEKIEKNQSYYLESINIVTEHRGKGGAKRLIKEMCLDANKLGYNLFSTHARICNGFNLLIRSEYEKSIKLVRRIENWACGGHEPYEYIEWWSCYHNFTQKRQNG